MINKIPFLGWFLSCVAATSLSIPFWICWTWGEIGKNYFYFVPELFIVIAILKGTLIPKLFSTSNSQTIEK